MFGSRFDLAIGVKFLEFRNARFCSILERAARVDHLIDHVFKIGCMRLLARQVF